jgi:hypothetical protein
MDFGLNCGLGNGNVMKVEGQRTEGQPVFGRATITYQGSARVTRQWRGRAARSFLLVSIVTVASASPPFPEPDFPELDFPELDVWKSSSALNCELTKSGDPAGCFASPAGFITVGPDAAM